METFLILLGIIFLLSGLDDLFIDFVHLFKRIKAKHYSDEEWNAIDETAEAPIAIMVPAWNEYDVISQMIRTNLNRIKYHNYQFFIGVYPNDLKTLSLARELQMEFPEKVNVVVTDRPGPTSKAHCLNSIFQAIKVKATLQQPWSPMFIAIHDAEDVIHPDSLKLVNSERDDADFIQFPVFALSTPLGSFVPGTYMDEFAENHLKELPVRQALRMPIPSAGVGTFFSREILSEAKDMFGFLFNEASLTEDYELSMRLAELKARQKFLVVAERNRKGIIATKGYFPDKIFTSIRQKTRWITGITLQSASSKFASTLAKKYGRWRDRKGLITNPVNLMGWITFFTIGSMELLHRMPSNSFHHEQGLIFLTYANFGIFCFRITQRFRFTRAIYGSAHGWVGIFRILIMNVINALATFRASWTFYRAKPNGTQKKPMKWDKTDHRFPTDEKLLEEQS